MSCPLSTKVLVTRQIFLTAAMSSVTQVYIFFFYLEHYDNTIRRKKYVFESESYSYQNLIMPRFFYRKNPRYIGIRDADLWHHLINMHQTNVLTDSWPQSRPNDTFYRIFYFTEFVQNSLSFNMGTFLFFYFGPHEGC